MSLRMKRRKFLTDSAKAGLGLVALAQVGGATPALAQQAPSDAALSPFLHKAYRAVLLISRGRTKQPLDGRRPRDRVELKKLMAGVVPGLRCQPGVHQVVPVFFHGWRDDVGKTPPPWRPNGALVFVQSWRLDKLQENIKGVYTAALDLDQEMMVLEPLGDLDSM